MFRVGRTWQIRHGSGSRFSPSPNGCALRRNEAEAGITRTGFYAKGSRPGPYQHLADEFHRRLQALQNNGDGPDPREAQIARLRTENTGLRTRLAAAEAAVAELTAFKQLALSRLTAQHDELDRLRNRHPEAPPRDNVRQLHPRHPPDMTGPCS